MLQRLSCLATCRVVIRAATCAALLMLAQACLAQEENLQAQPVLVNQTANEAGIPAPELNRIVAVLESDPQADWERERVGELRFRRVSLSGSDNDSIIVRSISRQDCGATGNCPVWVFRGAAQELEPVLSDAWVDSVRLAETAERGVRDLVLSANKSAASSTITVFAFNGKSYVQKQCYTELSDSAGRKSIRRTACAQTKGGDEP
jgi:hypothetical protein